MTTDAQAPLDNPAASRRPVGGVQPNAQLSERQERRAQSFSILEAYFGTAAAVVTYLALVGFLNLVLLYVAPARVPALRLAVASVLLWVCTAPMYDVVRRKPKQVPLFPIINVLYFIYFGLPVFLDTVMVKSRIYEVEEVTTAVALTLAGVLLMQLAFYSPFGKMVDVLPNLKMPFDLERIAWYCIVVAFLGVSLSAYVLTASRDIAPNLKAIANVTVRTPLLLLSGMLLLHLRGKLTFAQGIVASGCYLMYILFSLASGALAQLAWALVPMFFVYVAERGSIPWRAGILCILFAMPFTYSKHSFRKEIRNTYVGPLDRVALFLDLTMKQADADSSRFVENASRESRERTSYLGTLAFVINQTPRRIPHTDGETYRVMLWSFVPRIFAPDRPDQPLGQDFGHRYRLLNPQDHQTSFNCAQIVEMYMNFGPLGVFVGMLVVGLYYRALYALFNHGRGGDGMVILASAALAGLLNIESDASNVLVGAFQAAAFCFGVLLLVRVLAEHVIVVRVED
ncbi:MAG: hypothetical protein FJ095_00275 [Deltaproteobacteria bacterium]|nr:hypothetical protein [Deltaproteobacteria bacterium]